MSRRNLLTSVVAASIFGVLVATVPGEQRRLSIDLWLAAVAAWVAVSWLRAALQPVPTESIGLRSPFRFHWPTTSDKPSGHRALLALEGTVVSGLDSPRSFHHRLRPRLRELARHRLELDHGIDLDRQPEQARAVLGAQAWLIDPAENDRSPTEDDLARFLDRMEAERFDQKVQP